MGNVPWAHVTSAVLGQHVLRVRRQHLGVMDWPVSPIGDRTCSVQLSSHLDEDSRSNRGTRSSGEPRPRP